MCTLISLKRSMRRRVALRRTELSLVKFERVLVINTNLHFLLLACITATTGLLMRSLRYEASATSRHNGTADPLNQDMYDSHYLDFMCSLYMEDALRCSRQRGNVEVGSVVV